MRAIRSSSRATSFSPTTRRGKQDWRLDWKSACPAWIKEQPSRWWRARSGPQCLVAKQIRQAASSPSGPNNHTQTTKGVLIMDMKLEVVVLPVSDVDRAKRFYEKLGFRLDIDYAANEDYRIIQFTPPGSEASITFGKG